MKLTPIHELMMTANVHSFQVENKAHYNYVFKAEELEEFGEGLRQLIFDDLRENCPKVFIRPHSQGWIGTGNGIAQFRYIEDTDYRFPLYDLSNIKGE